MRPRCFTCAEPSDILVWVPGSVFYETLRLYPAVTTIPKRAAEDSVLRTRNAADEPVAVHIPKGSEIVLDTAGLHYNRTPSPSRFVLPYLLARAVQRTTGATRTRSRPRASWRRTGRATRSSRSAAARARVSGGASPRSRPSRCSSCLCRATRSTSATMARTRAARPRRSCRSGSAC